MLLNQYRFWGVTDAGSIGVLTLDTQNVRELPFQTLDSMGALALGAQVVWELPL